MGTGLPSAIGAAVKNSNSSARVIVLTGDSSLTMCIHVFHTAVSARIPITVVDFVNDDVPIISAEAKRREEIDERYESSATIGFEAGASGFSATTWFARTPSTNFDRCQ